MIPTIYLDWLFALARALSAPWITPLSTGIYPPVRPEHPAMTAPVERPKLRVVWSETET